MADFDAESWRPVPGEGDPTSCLRFQIEQTYADNLDVDIEDMIARAKRRIEMRARTAELASRPCTQCDRVKHPLAFSEHSRDGRRAVCKECEAELARERRANTSGDAGQVYK